MNKNSKTDNKEEVLLMKGNEAIAHAAIRCGCDGYFGYPITPQSEVMETLMELQPWTTTGMVVLQAESEVASINMVYGAAGCGKRAMTSSSSPGISLMQEGISYMVGAELPCVIVNVMRGGPGLERFNRVRAIISGCQMRTWRLQTSYAGACFRAGNGRFVPLAFDLAFKYRHPVMILADGIIGQMMEKVVLPPFQPRRTEAEIREQFRGNIG